MDNDVLAALRWEEGSLRYRGVRYLLLRPETVVGYQKAVEEKLGASARELMFAGGKLGGSLSARAYREQMGWRGGAIAVEMARMGGELGWARLVVEELDEQGGRLVIRAEDSAIAGAYGTAAAGVCHLLRGVFAGVAEEIFGVPVEAIEEQCAARGDPHCLFIFQAR